MCNPRHLLTYYGGVTERSGSSLQNRDILADMEKVCYGCNLRKDESEFHRESKRKDGLASQCKECRSGHYKKTYPSKKQHIRELVDARRRDLAEKVNNLKQKPCMDCGFPFPPYVMDFDHRGGEEKEAGIARMVWSTVSWARIEAEIAKCDLVCANCHRIRTYKRQLHSKLLGAVPERLTGLPAKQLIGSSSLPGASGSRRM